jgi:hypothetical protein
MDVIGHCRDAISAAAPILTPLGAGGADLVVWWEEGCYPKKDRAVAELVAAFEDQTDEAIARLKQVLAESPPSVGLAKW